MARREYDWQVNVHTDLMMRYIALADKYADLAERYEAKVQACENLKAALALAAEGSRN